MVLKTVFKQRRLQRPMHSKVMADKHMSRMAVFVSFSGIDMSNPFSVLPVCMQEFLILILQLLFSVVSVFMCHCSDLRLNNL